MISNLTHSTHFQAALSTQCLSCVPPWREASQYTGTQELRYEAAHVDQTPAGYYPRRDTQYFHNVTFPPATVSSVALTEILLKLTNLCSPRMA